MFGALSGNQQLQQGPQRSTPFGGLPSLPASGGALSSAMAAPQGALSSSTLRAAAEGPMDVSGMADNQLVEAPKLPLAPPKRPSLFDDEHRRETFLAIAAGMGQGQNFGEGLSAAAQNLLGLQRGLREEGRPEIGGPDDAFEITTDPATGERTYKPIEPYQAYNTERDARAAALKALPRSPTAMEGFDAIGRLASVVAKYPDAQQAQAWAQGRASMAAQGIQGIPETYNPAYREYGAPVPTMLRADTGAAGAAERGRHNLVREGIEAAKLQGTGRSPRRSQGGGRTTSPSLSHEEQYEYRSINGKWQRRRIK